MKNRIIIGLIFASFFMTGCAGPRHYSAQVRDQLLSRAVPAKDVIRPAEHEALLHSEVVLGFYQGEFTTLFGKSTLRKMQKGHPDQWPQGVRVIRIDASSKKEAKEELKRVRDFVNTIQGKGG